MQANIRHLSPLTQNTRMKWCISLESHLLFPEFFSDPSFSVSVSLYYLQATFKIQRQFNLAKYNSTSSYKMLHCGREHPSSPRVQFRHNLQHWLLRLGLISPLLKLVKEGSGFVLLSPLVKSCSLWTETGHGDHKRLILSSVLQMKKYVDSFFFFFNNMIIFLYSTET